MSNEFPTPDGADSLRDAARTQAGFKAEVEDSNTDDATRQNKFASYTWSPATGAVPDKK